MQAQQRDSTTTDPQEAESIDFRPVKVDDARLIWQLVKDSAALESNSCYCYLLLCRDFAETCLVACSGREIVGFVLAYKPPSRLDRVFVWQIGVGQGARGKGIARQLLNELISQPACQGVRYLEATVTPSNHTSRRLFQSFARQLGAELREAEGFAENLFAGSNHEPEGLLCIGPFNHGRLPRFSRDSGRVTENLSPTVAKNI